MKEAFLDLLMCLIGLGALCGIRYFIMDAVKDAMEDFYRNKKP